MAVLPPDPVFTLRCADMSSVNSVCFRDNECLVAGTIKGDVFVWDLKTNRSTLHFDVGKDPITSLHHTGDTLITQEKGGAITLWIKTGSTYEQGHNIPGTHLGYCRSALYTCAGREPLLFHPIEENTIGVLHIHNRSAPTQNLVPDDPQLPKLGSVTCLKPFELASQLFLIASYESGHIVTWDLSAGVIVDTLQLDPDAMALDYDPVTNRGIVGGSTEKLNVIHYNRQSMQLQRGDELVLKNPGVNCIRIRPDLKIFATGGWDGRIRLYSWKSLRQLAVLTQHTKGGVMDIAYSVAVVPTWKSAIMSSAGMDGQIALWDLYN